MGAASWWADRRRASAEDLASAGGDDAPIEIVPYEAGWPERFAAERARLAPLLPGAEIHHIGSTAVPGLVAKPTVDIMALVDDLDAPLATLTDLGGYELPAAYNAALGERRWLCRPSLRERWFHLHLVASREDLDRRLAFRDRLRADPELAARYGELKLRLAERYAHDREGYTRAKSAFIAAHERNVDALLDELAAWAGARPDVRAVALVGSRARHSTASGPDVDLVLLTDDPAAFIERDEWAFELGGTSIAAPRRWGAITERRLALPGGIELDVAVGRSSWAATEPLDPGTARVVGGGLRVVHDPDGLLADLVVACSA